MKCSAELERSTIGIDSERRPPAITVLFGTHRYDDEEAGDSGEVEGEIEWIPQEDVERKEYESLNFEERRDGRPGRTRRSRSNSTETY